MYHTMSIILLLLLHLASFIYSSSNGDIKFDGSQYISTAMIANPLHTKNNELGIIFRTTLSSCLLFYASGIGGDYMALELIRGKIRFVANSDGIESINKPTIEMIHGDNYVNYADGEYHQVNVEIGEYTKVYSYTFPKGKSNETVAHSNAKDLRFDLDEVLYYLGIPRFERTRTKNIFMSKMNFKGCLNSISFNKEKIRLTRLFFQNSKTVLFSGKLLHDCDIEKPKYLKSFNSIDQYLNVYSHANKNKFQLRFSYRTYLQTGIVVKSIPTNNNNDNKRRTSVLLKLVDNYLIFTANISEKLQVQFVHYDASGDDGTWKAIFIQITSSKVLFQINQENYSYKMSKEIEVSFSNLITFSGSHGNYHGFIGCIKDVYIGNTIVNEILQLDSSINYAEAMCQMTDLCFPINPCFNKGRCIQQVNHVTCNCTNTGFKGKLCDIEDKVTLLKSCDDYFHSGYRKSGYYLIKPGKSSPFKVMCEMNVTLGGPKTIVETNLQNRTYVFTGKDFDRHYYYHYISYKATKKQILELIEQSTFCKQYVRYSCYESVLLNTKDPSHLTELGVRWFSRNGLKQSTWHSNEDNKPICQCARNGNCAQSNLQCNCDVMDKKLRFDDGFITEQNDLPISKIRVSILKTNHRSSFYIGSLQCNSHATINNNNKIEKSLIANQNITSPVNNGNKTSDGLNKRPALKFLIIDRKLLYIIIASIVLFILVFVLLLLFKRYLCCYQRSCCNSYDNSPKPQIIEIYTDRVFNENNNKNLLNNRANENEINLLLYNQRGQSSSTSSSVSTIDPSAYFAPPDSSDDNQSLQSCKSISTQPTKGILKIKKDSTLSLTKQQKQQQEMLVQLQKQQEYADDKVFHEEDEDDEEHCTSVSLIHDLHLKVKPKEQQVIYCKNHKKHYEGVNNSSPLLKQKVLELSTARTAYNLDTRKLYSSSSLSSVSSSKENSSSEDELLTNSSNEKKPLHRLNRSKSVRFNDGDDTNSPSEKKLKTTSMHEEVVHFLYNDDKNTTKTLV